MLPVVDANVLLRYLLNDVPDQATFAREVVAAGCEVYPETLAEVVYVLMGVYGVPRAQISHVLLNLIEVVFVDRVDELSFALELFADEGLDFVACILLAQNQVSGREVITFDKKLAKRLRSDSYSQ